jgi:hypothetical protein
LGIRTLIAHFSPNSYRENHQTKIKITSNTKWLRIPTRSLNMDRELLLLALQRKVTHLQSVTDQIDVLPK